MNKVDASKFNYPNILDEHITTGIELNNVDILLLQKYIEREELSDIIHFILHLEEIRELNEDECIMIDRYIEMNNYYPDISVDIIVMLLRMTHNYRYEDCCDEEFKYRLKHLLS